MNVDYKVAQAALRMSISQLTTIEEITEFTRHLVAMHDSANAIRDMYPV
jgi:cysteine sulfinate desulfinase/cysteine desulfurase-like protein